MNYRSTDRRRVKSPKRRPAQRPRKDPISTLPRSIQSVSPRNNNVQLRYEATTNLLGATIPNPFAYQYLNLTNPMISFGGSATNVPFFTMWATGYRKFRVRSFHVSVQFCNAETNIMNCFVCPFNYLPPNTAASNTAALDNILCRKQLVSAKGGMDRGTIRIGNTVNRMAGFASTNVEDAYVGLTDGTSPPSDNIYALVAVQTNGIASVVGILASITVQFSIDFIERQTPLT